MNIKCWWLGHQYNLLDDPDSAHCTRCDEPLGYSDFVEPSRYDEFKSFMIYWLFRKWYPIKCHECGNRYGCHDDCLPF